MRKFRNSALAIATATTVAFGGVAVASAQDNTDPVVLSDSLSSPSASSELGDSLNKFGEVNGEQLFGSGDHETQPNGSLPNFTAKDGTEATWAKAMYGVGIAAAIASFIGLIAGPVYNFFTHNMFG